MDTKGHATPAPADRTSRLAPADPADLPDAVRRILDDETQRFGAAQYDRIEAQGFCRLPR